eukprot:TRINITY_DN34591_c0_g1_i1.p1 TRINITY_DN34591_c0_g1~~TRINITY_DN34591_c0_g1_i1.p1  ORF type:complete len:146 (+),score=29.26 TRINITY_DN34591_c0_g1_i1:64-501(+)
MLIPRKYREEIAQYLFKEGVLVAPKAQQGTHPHLQIPNLFVVQMMRSFTSKGLVREQYAWRHHYYYLTNEGIIFLRDMLHLPAEIVPSTLKKTTRTVAQTQRSEGGDRPRQSAGRGSGAWGRNEYRRDGGDKAPAPQNIQAQFNE